MAEKKIKPLLEKFGIDVSDLIKLDEKSLSLIFRIPEEKAKELLKDVLHDWFLESKFISGEELLQSQKVNVVESVFPTINKMIGGFKVGTLIQFYGPYASGKTNVLLTHLAEYLQKGVCYWIDSEQTFDINRLKQIMENRNIDLKYLKNLKYQYAPSSNLLELSVFKFFEEVLLTKNVYAIFIDSLLAPYRAEYIGIEELASRQQRINWLLRHLLRFAEIVKIPIFFTNQVVASPGKFTEWIPIGGHITSHSSTYIFKLTKQGKYRKLIADDIPWAPQFEIVFKITEKGVEEVEKAED